VSDYYVRSSDGDDGYAGTASAPKATAAGAYAAMSAGDRALFSDLHSETITANLSPPGTAASPCQSLCIEDWGSESSPTLVLSTGALLDIAATTYRYIDPCWHCFDGLTFGQSATSGGWIFGSSSSAANYMVMRNAIVQATNGYVNPGVTYYAKGSIIEWDNVTLQTRDYRARIETGQGLFVWRGGTVSVIASTAPSGGLFRVRNGRETGTIRVSNVDLSVLGSNAIVLASEDNQRDYTFHRCRLGSSATLLSGSITGQHGTVARFVECDSTTDYIRQHYQDYQGTVTDDTVHIRDDSDSSYSFAMASSAYTQFYSPLRSFAVARINTTEGSSVTVRMETLTDGVTLTDGDFWMEVSYLGNASYPLGSIASSAKSSVLATAANLSTSSEGWTTADLASPVKQYAEVTFTPQESGPIEIVACLAKVSTTVYVDPDVEVS